MGRAMRTAPLLLALMLALAPPARGGEGDALRAARAAAAQNDWPAAAAAARGAGAVGADIVEWMRLRAGEGTLTDYESFLARRPGWPGLTLLRQKGETAVARSTTPARVIAWFGPNPPATATGAVALVRALAAAGEAERAAVVARTAWVTLDLDEAGEAALLAAAGPALAGAHGARLERLLADGRAAAARRMLARVDPGRRALAEARLALQEGQSAGIEARIAAVPAALAGDPGLALDRFQWRMDRGLYDGAAELILARSAAGTLGDPAAWAKRRAALARELLERGQVRQAHAVAAGHGLRAGADFADLEFLAGFIALRRLDDPAEALVHFRRLGAAVSTPISRARAAYWEGRALAAQGQAEAAEAALRAAARHPATYYGLLAAERLGLPLDPALLAPARPAGGPPPLAHPDVLEAARALARAGDRAQARRFWLHLAEGLPAGDIARLAETARTEGETHIALVLAKRASEAGAGLLPDHAFPVPAMVPDGLAVSRALALAIARRESEFDPAVVSPAGAMGLMQVMPATAEMMARAEGLPYSRPRLTADPAYNVRLGAAYLSRLVEEFGPAVALVAAGYNAGPGRPRRWLTAFGDPRDPGTDVIDWVEMIPIAETRTYVMRVAESLVIYRARLRGAAGPVRLTSELTGR